MLVAARRRRNNSLVKNYRAANSEQNKNSAFKKLNLYINQKTETLVTHTIKANNAEFSNTAKSGAQRQFFANR